MSYIKEKTVYHLCDKNRQTGFEVTVNEEGVEIDTISGMDAIEFIQAMDILLVTLKEKYQYGDGP
jgi:hypothetical protein